MKTKITLVLLVLTVAIVTTACKKKIEGCTNSLAINFDADADTDDGSCITVGNSYLGGKLAYIFQPGDPGYDAGTPHGIIVAPYDQSSSANWGCKGTLINGADAMNIGSGNQNTLDIIAGCTDPGCAAKICYDLVIGGYSDWYLPSKDELEKVYQWKSVIGGYSNAYYWSSSEQNADNAFCLNFDTGAFGTAWPGGENSKDHFAGLTGYVRAIRSF